MRIVYLAICFILFATPSSALDIPSRPLGYVSDFAGILSYSDKQQIESLLKGQEQTTSNQIAVAIFNSLDGQSLEDFSIRLADTWKIGQKNKNNGVILIIFIADRKMRIEVGYGLEPYLTDALSDQISRGVIAPRFKEGNYAEGILNGVNSIISIIGGDTTGFTLEPRSRSHSKNDNAGFIIMIIIGALVIDFLRYTFYFIRNKSYTNRYHVLEWFIRFSILLFVLKVLMSARSNSGGSRGGFSGGGGRFGGGGASGGW